MQAVFAALSVLEVVYALLNEIFMNTEVRIFYKAKLGFPTRVKVLPRRQDNVYN